MKVLRCLWALALLLCTCPAFHFEQGCTLPALIDATADELQEGLAEGCFTSVDLVNVVTSFGLGCLHMQLTLDRLMYLESMR